MKRSKLIFHLMLCVFITASCKKSFLDKAPSVNLPEEQVFSNPTLASQFADNAYNYLVNDYARLNDHRGITGQAADEAVSGNNDVSIRTLSTGLYHDHYERGGEPKNDIRDVYTRAYSGIRITNVMLAKMDGVKWTTAFSPNRIKGEMHFLRAYLYFELVKRFGGVILIDKAYGVNDELDFPRSSYDDCVKFILADLDEAENLLPEDYDNSNYGRATLGAAKALRARTLLYAASPLNNESNDLKKWQEAAQAAKAVMDMNKYSLQATYADLLNVPTSPEYIMIKIRGPRGAQDGLMLDFAMSPGSGGSQGSLNPTQNHVDLYEMKATGRPITDPASTYDPTKPYVGRDPRFYANILYNDAPWQGRKIEMWGPKSRDYDQNSITYTATRYYCRKMWPEPYNNRISTGTTLLNYIHFRYGEVLLNYAEAQNEFAGPDQSVLDAVNAIRARSSMPALQTTNPTGAGYVAPNKDAMRARIRNERAVELAFEDFRWYDIQRWKVGPQIVAQPMYGMDVIKNANGTFTYNKILLPPTFQKVFLDYMHRYPIPRSEIYKSKGTLVQNPGW
jgi:starch-binding outer membrane protein, SusD/RagB family